jgi:hypothetical protein
MSTKKNRGDYSFKKNMGADKQIEIKKAHSKRSRL